MPPGTDEWVDRYTLRGNPSSATLSTSPWLAAMRSMSTRQVPSRSHNLSATAATQIDAERLEQRIHRPV